MMLNSDKTKYMVFNFIKSVKFQTRLSLNNSLLEEVRKTHLLDLLISDDLTWNKNTNTLVKRAYQQMAILRNLYEFKISVENMIGIYILFIRSVVEQTCVISYSSITNEE